MKRRAVYAVLLLVVVAIAAVVVTMHHHHSGARIPPVHHVRKIPTDVRHGSVAELPAPYSGDGTPVTPV